MQIVNIVATVKLSKPLDLSRMAECIKGTEMSSGGVKWLKMRLAPENRYVAFYKSGKFLITGVTSLDEVETVSNRVLQILRQTGFDLSKEKATVHNVVMMDTVQLRASLEKVLRYLGSSKASYEPEQFPGLLYKDQGASFLLFSSGKFIITGVRELEAGQQDGARFKRLIEEIQ
jgi:transcription initiation factor TFIID TATA-box-binding protein